jgi:hypothetical protein
MQALKEKKRQKREQWQKKVQIGVSIRQKRRKERHIKTKAAKMGRLTQEVQKIRFFGQSKCAP